MGRTKLISIFKINLSFIIKYITVFSLLIGYLNCQAQKTQEKAKESFKNKNYQLTLDELSSINSSEINFDSLLYIKAYSEIKLNKIKEAGVSISQLQQINPNYYESHFLKGLIYALKEKYPDAISSFNKVLDSNPTHEKALYNRAIAKGLLEDYSGAIKDLDKCISLNSTYALAYYNRGFWHEQSGNFDNAINDYSKTISLDKHYSEAYIALAYAYSQKGNNLKACETLSKAKDEGVEMATDLIQNFCK